MRNILVTDLSDFVI